MRQRSLFHGLAILVGAILVGISSGGRSTDAREPAAWITADATQFKYKDEVTIGSTWTTVRVPITLNSLPQNSKLPIDPKTIKVRVKSVSFDGRVDENLISAFEKPNEKNDPKSEPSPQVDSRGQAILFDIDISKVSATGTYTVSVVASTTTSQTPPLTDQRLEFQFIHPPATLRTIPTLIVDRELLPFNDPSVRYTPLILKETSSKSSMTGGTLQPLSFTDATMRAVTGSVKLSDTNPVIVPPGGSITSLYELTGNFALGVTRGTAEIHAPQLAAPVAVTFEIHTRRAWWLLIPVLVGGLATGYVIRVLLENQIQLNQARVKGFDLLNRSEEERTRRPDAVFARSLDEPSQTLVIALAGTDLAKINVAITNADNALRTGLTQLDTRRASAQSVLDALDKILKTGWLLPEDMNSALEQARVSQKMARNLLSGDDVKGAEDTENNIEIKLIQDLNNALSDWKTGTILRLMELQKSDLNDVPLPTTVTAVLTSAAIQLSPLLMGILPIDPDSGAVGISGQLAAVHNVMSNLRDLLRQIAGSLQSTVEQLEAVLPPVIDKIPAPDQVKSIRTKVMSFVEDLRKSAERPDLMKGLLSRPVIEELDVVWRQGIEAQMAKIVLTDPDKADLAKKLHNRQYIEAARFVSSALKKAAAGPESTLLATDHQLFGESFTGARQIEEWVSRSVTAPLPELSIPVVRVEALPAPIHLSRQKTLQDLFRVKFLQTLIVGTLIVLGGTLMYADKFVGTPTEMMAIFFWAFSLDVTVEALMQVAKSIHIST